MLPKSKNALSCSSSSAETGSQDQIHTLAAILKQCRQKNRVFALLDETHSWARDIHDDVIFEQSHDLHLRVIRRIQNFDDLRVQSHLGVPVFEIE